MANPNGSNFSDMLLKQTAEVAKATFSTERDYDVTITFTLSSRSEVGAAEEMGRIIRVMKEYYPNLKGHKLDIVAEHPVTDAQRMEVMRLDGR